MSVGFYGFFQPSPLKMSLRLARVFAARILPLHHHGFATSMPKISPIRGLHGTRVASYPRKGSQDKDSIDREPNEYSKSGTDEETAEQEQAAFDPNITDPHKEQSKAGEGKKVIWARKSHTRNLCLTATATLLLYCHFFSRFISNGIL